MPSKMISTKKEDNVSNYKISIIISKWKLPNTDNIIIFCLLKINISSQIYSIKAPKEKKSSDKLNLCFINWVGNLKWLKIPESNNKPIPEQLFLYKIMKLSLMKRPNSRMKYLKWDKKYNSSISSPR